MTHFLLEAELIVLNSKRTLLWITEKVMNKKWIYIENENKWILQFTPHYQEIIVAELMKDECGDWLLSSDVLKYNKEYVDDFNDHINLEAMQYFVEDKIHEHYLDEERYYGELAKLFME